MPELKPGLGIIGAGKVGCTLARLLANGGYTVAAVYDRLPDHARQLAEQVDGRTAGTPDVVVAQANLVLVTVPDDAIQTAAESITAVDLTGKGFIHTSGAHDRHSLVGLAERGAMVGSLHPAFPFANVEAAVAGLPGATFALEYGDAQLGAWLQDIVQALNGQVITIPPGGKAAYHLALVLASNFTVTLYALAEQVLLSLGTDRAAADNALNVLLAATVANLQQQGIPQALTGPLARADTGTLAAHLKVLRQGDPMLLDVYRNLARLSYPMLEARGVSLTQIEQVLEQYANHDS